MTISTQPITDKEIVQLKKKFGDAGQDHVFTFFDTLDAQEQQALLSQLATLDVERLNNIYKKSFDAANQHSEAATVDPLDDSVNGSVLKAEPATREAWRNAGLTLIAAGKVAVILLAGGQGTRLGSSDPKGCYNINLPSGKSLFQLQAERILRLQNIASPFAVPAGSEVVIPWYIMTSGPTHQATYDFFKSKGFFGLKEENVIFFQQGTLPCLTKEGKIILESKGKIAVAPDGNGGIYAALQNEGVISDLNNRDIQYTHCYCVDNCLARVADPVFIGYCASKGADCGVKVVPKRSSKEPVGVVCQRNGKYGVVEYSEISEELAEKTNKDGSLAFGAANIVNHFFSTKFLENVQNHAQDLEYHIANKKIKYVDLATGEVVTPTANSGIKLECFVFDVFPFASHFAVLEVERQEEFAPLKNAPGSNEDCPETSRRAILEQSIRFIEKAGGKVEGSDDLDQLDFEISPIVSYSGEGLEKVKGKTIPKGTQINTHADLEKLV